jgi:transposase
MGLDMRTKKYAITLTDDERKTLRQRVKSGTHTARSITRANILLNLDEGLGEKRGQVEVAKICGVSTVTVYNVGKQYATEGLEAVLSRKKRKTPPVPSKITGEIEAKIIALCCGKPPEGRTRWTLRLLEEKTVELGIVEAISDNTIGRLLKKHCLNLTDANIGASRQSITAHL